MWEYNYYNPNELYHYGVKGMRWGKRKTRQWATAQHQPSSFKSSVLAGTYAATGNRRVGEALGRSNDRDAERWKQAKDADPKSYEKKPMSTQKKVAIGVAVTAGVLAAGYGAYKVNNIVKNKAYNKSVEAGKRALSSLVTDSKTHDYLSKDIESAARYNSRNFVQSVKTIKKNQRRLSRAELKAMGIDTFDP